MKGVSHARACARREKPEGGAASLRPPSCIRRLPDAERARRRAVLPPSSRESFTVLQNRAKTSIKPSKTDNHERFWNRDRASRSRESKQPCFGNDLLVISQLLMQS